MDKQYANFRGAEVVEVIRLEVNEGSGVPGDPICRVVYYLTKDGEIIGHNDPTDRELRGVAWYSPPKQIKQP